MSDIAVGEMLCIDDATLPDFFQFISLKMLLQISFTIKQLSHKKCY